MKYPESGQNLTDEEIEEMARQFLASRSDWKAATQQDGFITIYWKIALGVFVAFLLGWGAIYWRFGG